MAAEEEIAKQLEQLLLKDADTLKPAEQAFLMQHQKRALILMAAKAKTASDDGKGWSYRGLWFLAAALVLIPMEKTWRRQPPLQTIPSNPRYLGDWMPGTRGTLGALEPFEKDLEEKEESSLPTLVVEAESRAPAVGNIISLGLLPYLHEQARLETLSVMPESIDINVIDAADGFQPLIVQSVWSDAEGHLHIVGEGGASLVLQPPARALLTPKNGGPPRAFCPVCVSVRLSALLGSIDVDAVFAAEEDFEYALSLAHRESVLCDAERRGADGQPSCAASAPPSTAAADGAEEAVGSERLPKLCGGHGAASVRNDSIDAASLSWPNHR